MFGRGFCSPVSCETKKLFDWVKNSFVGLFMGDSLVPGHWVLRSFFPIWSIKDSKLINLLRPRGLVGSRVGHRVGWYSVHSSLFMKIGFLGSWSFRFACLRLKESWTLGQKVQHSLLPIRFNPRVICGLFFIRFVGFSPFGFQPFRINRNVIRRSKD